MNFISEISEMWIETEAVRQTVERIWDFISEISEMWIET